MKKATWFLLLLTLFSCSAPNNKDSDKTMTDTAISDTTTENTTATTEKELIKDEKGFYILPDNYLEKGEKEEGKKVSRISYTDAMMNPFEEYKVFINDKRVTPYKVKVDVSHRFKEIGNEREDDALLSLRMEGYCKVTIQLKHPIYRKVTIRPLQASLPYEVDKDYRTVSFYVYNKGQYTIEFNDYMTKTLHLFVDDFKDETQYKNDSSVLYFNKGIHNSQNDNRIPKDNIIRLNNSIKTVYLEEGAILQAGIFAYQVNDIKILGHGMIDGSVFTRNATTNERLIPVDFQYCKNTLIQDVIFTDPAGWCLNLYYLDGVLIDNVKIITSRANGDGISVQSSKNVEVKNCFVRTFDDTLVVKNYPRYGNYQMEGSTSNIYFHDCILITDLAQSMEVGYETIGEEMHDIRFENITVLHNYHHAVFSIHNANNAKIRNVTYKNITVEDASMGEGDGNGKLLDFNVKHSSIWSDNWKVTKLGDISTVSMENIMVTGKDAPLVIEGSKDSRDNTIHQVSDVTITNFKLNDKVIKESDFQKNEYVKGLSVQNTGKEITGSHINYSYTLEQVKRIYSSMIDFVS